METARFSLICPSLCYCHCRDRKGKAKTSPSRLEDAISDTIAPARATQLIQSHFPLTAVPSVPEIRVHKARPESGLWRLAEADESFGAPYWAHYWGGGLALARHILDHSETVAGRRVLDLGAGSGLVGIAAARSGASHVVAADVDPYAIVAIGLNAAANGVAISPILGDPTTGPPPEVDIVLVGDLFYEAVLAQQVTAFLDRCLESKIDVLVGDPWRKFLPVERLETLAEYSGGDFGDIGEQTRNAVFSFKPG